MKDWECGGCGKYKDGVSRTTNGFLCSKCGISCRKCENLFLKKELAICDWCKATRCNSCGPLPDYCRNGVRPHK